MMSLPQNPARLDQMRPHHGADAWEVDPLSHQLWLREADNHAEARDSRVTAPFRPCPTVSADDPGLLRLRGTGPSAGVGRGGR